MTGRADLPDFDEEAVAITIIEHVFNKLKVPGCHAFDPIFFTGPGPKTGFSQRKSPPDGFFVHIGHHEDFFGFDILDDGGNKALLIELQFMERLVR